MARSRADDILEEWKMLAHSASKPAGAPYPKAYRSSLSFGVLGVGAVALVVVVGIAFRGGLGPQTPANPGGNVSPSQPVTSSPTPAGSPAVAPSPSPTITAEGPSAADVAAAGDAVDRYTADLVRGDDAAAWAMLGPEEQAAQGSLASFGAERSAFFKSVAGRYVVKTQPTDAGSISDWVAGAHGAPIDLHQAVLVEVDYPALAGNNAGYDLYIVNPGPSGPEIYSVR